jgi:hypothetical protein
MKDITTEELKILCDTTVKLTELRHSTCNHLNIENASSAILAKLIQAVLLNKAEIVPATSEIDEFDKWAANLGDKRSCIELGQALTVGELKSLLSPYQDDAPFGFRNQPTQSLYELHYQSGSVGVVFQ